MQAGREYWKNIVEEAVFGRVNGRENGQESAQGHERERERNKKRCLQDGGRLSDSEEQPAGRKRIQWKELAAAALLMLCFWGLFYPELALPPETYQKTDGSAPDASDYEKLLKAEKGELRITFSFLGKKQGKRTEAGQRPETETHREDDDIGIAGKQREAHRSV